MYNKDTLLNFNAYSSLQNYVSCVKKGLHNFVWFMKYLGFKLNNHWDFLKNKNITTSFWLADPLIYDPQNVPQSSDSRVSYITKLLR